MFIHHLLTQPIMNSHDCNCKHCDKSFKKNNHSQKFCSIECRKMNEKQNAIKHDCTCQHCGINFKSTNKQQKYCGKSCNNYVFAKMNNGVDNDFLFLKSTEYDYAGERMIRNMKRKTN